MRVYSHHMSYHLRRTMLVAGGILCVLSVIFAIWHVFPAHANQVNQVNSHQSGARSTATNIRLSKNAYPPTSLIDVNGTGFGVNEGVDIFFDTTDLALAQSDASGNFTSIVIQVPASAIPGTHWVTATGRTSALSAQASFLVSTNWPQAGFSSQHQGLNPYENVLSPGTVGSLQLDWSTPTLDRNQGNSNSPTIAGGNVYFNGWNIRNVYGFNQITGNATYRTTISDQLFGPSDELAYLQVNGSMTWVLLTSSGFGSSNPRGAVEAYKLSGCSVAPCPLLWSQPSPINPFITYANGIVYSFRYDAFVHAYDAATGTPLWTSAAVSDGFDWASVAKGIVYATSEDGFLYALDATTGVLLWKDNLTTGFEGSNRATIANGNIYINTPNGILSVYSASGCGQPICDPLWTATVGSLLSADPVVANGVVYVAPGGGGLYAFPAAGCGHPTCTPLWVGTTDSYLTALSVANGVVYGSGWWSGSPLTAHLYAFAAAGCGGATCTPLWTYPFPNDTLDAQAPAISNGMVYVVTYSSVLYAFHLPGTSVLPARPNPALLHPNLKLLPSLPRLTPLPDLPGQG